MSLDVTRSLLREGEFLVFVVLCHCQRQIDDPDFCARSYVHHFTDWKDLSCQRYSSHSIFDVSQISRLGTISRDGEWLTLSCSVHKYAKHRRKPVLSHERSVGVEWPYDYGLKVLIFCVCADKHLLRNFAGRVGSRWKEGMRLVYGYVFGRPVDLTRADVNQLFRMFGGGNADHVTADNVGPCHTHRVLKALR